MKQLITFFLVVLAGINEAIGCTTFLINKNGQLVFGRNYDWVTDAGMVCKNSRGLAKTSLRSPDGGTINWVSKYGSLTFNQYGKEFPTGGMNEKGLVVELMWLDGSRYPKPDDRASVNVLQWIQFQLDNCSTIEEVIATDKHIRIGSNGNPPLHYLVADANGRAATIEFLDGKMVVHKGKDLPIPVLTNTDYATSAKMVNNSNASGGSESVRFNDNSVERFAKACSMVKEFQQADTREPILDYSFNILKKVSQEGWTRWSIVYDITNRMVYFKTTRFPSVKSIGFTDFDFNCNSQSIAFDMNQSLQGKVSKEFKPFTKEIHKKLIDLSAEESKSQINISEASKKRTIEYAEGVACK